MQLLITVYVFMDYSNLAIVKEFQYQKLNNTPMYFIVLF